MQASGCSMVHQAAADHEGGSHLDQPVAGMNHSAPAKIDVHSLGLNLVPPAQQPPGRSTDLQQQARVIVGSMHLLIEHSFSLLLLPEDGSSLCPEDGSELGPLFWHRSLP